MNKQGIMKIVRGLSKVVPFQVSEYGTVSHPLTNSFVVINPKDNTMLDLRNDENRTAWFESVFARMENVTDPRHIFGMINKPYWLELLYWSKDYLDEQEFNTILSDAWINTEFPHQSGNKRLLELFERAKPELLMEEEDRVVYDQLPQEITIYRGLQGKKAKIRGLSWTTDLEVAKWFANRFDYHGKIYRAKIKKKDVIWFCAGRNESEVIVHPRKLRQIEEVTS